MDNPGRQSAFLTGCVVAWWGLLLHVMSISELGMTLSTYRIGGDLLAENLASFTVLGYLVSNQYSEAELKFRNSNEHFLIGVGVCC